MAILKTFLPTLFLAMAVLSPADCTSHLRGLQVVSIMACKIRGIAHKNCGGLKIFVALNHRMDPPVRRQLPSLQLQAPPSRVTRSASLSGAAPSKHTSPATMTRPPLPPSPCSVPPLRYMHPAQVNNWHFIMLTQPRVLRIGLADSSS